ncbi:hypothetical protein NL676_018786 [Syzygium grande]|nr:hypothetical protein NL676_018786 [Syzygium grande]
MGRRLRRGGGRQSEAVKRWTTASTSIPTSRRRRSRSNGESTSTRGPRTSPSSSRPPRRFRPGGPATHRLSLLLRLWSFVLRAQSDCGAELPRRRWRSLGSRFLGALERIRGFRAQKRAVATGEADKAEIGITRPSFVLVLISAFLLGAISARRLDKIGAGAAAAAAASSMILARASKKLFASFPVVLLEPSAALRRRRRRRTGRYELE